MKNMRQMSDKDFDKLFHEKFSSWEVEPSDTVWPGISSKLDRNRKKPFPVLWLAAASIAAVLGFGLWFSSQKEPMKLTGTAGTEVIKEKKSEGIKPVQSIAADNNVSVSKPQEKRIKKVQLYASTATVAESNGKHKVALTRVTYIQTDLPGESDLGTDQGSRKIEVATSAVNTQALAHSLVDNDLETEAEEPEKAIKNSKSVVSSVVNFVISRVDKRKDKIIELEDNDEGTKVKSLNLIVVKFKAKQ